MDAVDEPVKRMPLILPGMKRKPRALDTNKAVADNRPSAVFKFVPKAIRAHFVVMLGEFLGTFVFLLFALGGTQVVKTEIVEEWRDPARLLYVALCFGFSFAIAAWIFFRVSGGLFNPAITLALCLVGSLSYLRGLLVILSQIVGAIAAAALVDGLLPGPLTVRTTLGGGISIVRGLFLEMFLTALVVLTVLLLAAERHRSNHLAPVGVGLSLFVAHLFGLYYTGASVNPARSFGPSVVMRDFEGHHWIYWVGPLLGSLVAASFYQILKSLEYEPLQPGQHVADAHHSDPTDAPRRYDDSDPAGDVDEYKRSGATHHAHTPAGLNGVNQGTTNDPARNNAYASGPGIEAGRH